MSTEALTRAQFFPQLKGALSQLPPKLIEIDADMPCVADETEAGGGESREGAGPRIERVRASILKAHFTGRGDKSKVVSLYNAYITKIANAMVDSGEAGEGEYTGERNTAGQREGRGTERFADGDVYEGEFKAGKREGRGTFTFSYGDVYEGEFKAGKKEGRGTYNATDGGAYEGEYKADLMDGRGRYRFVDGNVYEGEFKAGKQEGRATFRYADARAEVGRYVAGADAGEGCGWSADGTQAWRLRDGEMVEEISLATAAKIAAAVGLPVPAAQGT